MKKYKNRELTIECPMCSGSGKVTTNDFKVLFGHHIQQRRRELRMTQEDLAFKTGYTRTAIVTIENGKQNVPLDKIYALADALGIDAKDLF